MDAAGHLQELPCINLIFHKEGLIMVCRKRPLCNVLAIMLLIRESVIVEEVTSQIHLSSLKK